MRKTPPEELIPGALEKYTHDLTALASQGQFAPLQRREKEVERIFQVLARTRRNNPILLGEDSAERFAIVAEVFRRISTGDMPEGVKARHVVALDFEAIMARAQTAAQCEKLLRAVVAGLTLSEGQTLLFIDNMQVLLSGGWTRGTFNATTVIMPALSRGEIVVLGTMTSEDYQKYMMSNAARYRRCQEIVIVELSD